MADPADILPRMHRVILYSRDGCHLCDVARSVLEDVRAAHPFELTEVDVDTHDALIRDLGYRVPVVSLDGEELFELEVDADRLAELVRAPAAPIG